VTISADAGTSRPLRVALVSREYPPGAESQGIGAYTRRLSQGLRAAGHDVTIVHHGRDATRRRDDDGVPVWEIAAPEPSSWARRLLGKVRHGGTTAYWLRQSQAAAHAVDRLAARERDFDIVETPLWDLEAAAFAGRRRPLLIRLQTPNRLFNELNDLPVDPRRDRAERRMLHRASVLGAISHSVGDLVRQQYGVDPARILYTPLGVDRVDGWSYDPRGPRRLLYVGRLEERKGTPELFAALAIALAADDQLEVDVVGRDASASGNAYRRLFSSIVPPQQHHRVRFHAWIDDAARDALYRECAVFVAPSRYESFGQVFIEAMAYGRPVIGTAVGGIPELVNDSVGRMVPAEDAASLAAAIVDLMAAPELRAEMSRRAAERARREFTIERMVEATVDAYRAAIAGGRRRG
jgi:glycogen synthase